MPPSRRSLLWLCVPLVGFLFLAFALDLAPGPRPVQASGEPTYYLDDDTYEVNIYRATDQWWDYGCFEAWTEAEVKAVVFHTSKASACPQFKPMAGWHAGCSGADLWTDTSAELSSDTYWCYGSPVLAMP